MGIRPGNKPTAALRGNNYSRYIGYISLRTLEEKPLMKRSSGSGEPAIQAQGRYSPHILFGSRCRQVSTKQTLSRRYSSLARSMQSYIYMPGDAQTIIQELFDCHRQEAERGRERVKYLNGAQYAPSSALERSGPFTRGKHLRGIQHSKIRNLNRQYAVSIPTIYWPRSEDFRWVKQSQDGQQD